mmetsp:Transcript_98547/g.177947  ORF Transcript_98547/g.177947 Transcript_98547/m.177947 type:complete len:172 (+) Transcript_98547:995-1510(+)
MGDLDSWSWLFGGEMCATEPGIEVDERVEALEAGATVVTFVGATPPGARGPAGSGLEARGQEAGAKAEERDVARAVATGGDWTTHGLCEEGSAARAAEEALDLAEEAAGCPPPGLGLTTATWTGLSATGNFLAMRSTGGKAATGLYTSLADASAGGWWLTDPAGTAFQARG